MHDLWQSEGWRFNDRVYADQKGNVMNQTAETKQAENLLGLALLNDPARNKGTAHRGRAPAVAPRGSAAAFDEKHPATG